MPTNPSHKPKTGRLDLSYRFLPDLQESIKDTFWFRLVWGTSIAPSSPLSPLSPLFGIFIGLINSYNVASIALIPIHEPKTMSNTLLLLGTIIAAAIIMAVVFWLVDISDSDMSPTKIEYSSRRLILGHLAVGVLWPLVIISLLLAWNKERRRYRKIGCSFISGRTTSSNRYDPT